MSAVSANKLEILQIADAVAREKGIERELVIQAMEEAMQKAARARYGMENDIRASIDHKTGETTLRRVTTVVETVENDHTEISLKDARRRNPDADVGDVIEELLPPMDFGRVQAQTAKQVITQKVRDAERERQHLDYKDRVGEIINGIVKRMEYGNIIVDLGKAEAIVRKDQALPRETFGQGDRIRAFLYEVRKEAKGPQIFLSRAHPQFMVKLFAQEVPEVYDNVIEIKACARDPGSRAKIAVMSHDSSIDPVGACVGMRGARVQAVVGELQGEKIDIIPWSSDPATFIVNALQPAEVTKVVLDEEENRVEVVVPDTQLSLAIGRRGQNVRLASTLTGWQIDITTEAEDSERRQKEFQERTSLFMNALDVDEMMAQLLATEGFESIDEIAFVDHDDLAIIEGLDDDTAEELQNRARDFVERENAELDVKRREMGVEDALLEIPGLNLKMIVALAGKDVRTVEDLAGLTAEELRGWWETKQPETSKPVGIGRGRIEVKAKPEGKRERIWNAGLLDGFKISEDDAKLMVLNARVMAGWIDPAVLKEPLHGEAVEAIDQEADA
jgi:N utilization substance protein A